MIEQYQTIRGPIAKDRPKEAYFVTSVRDLARGRKKVKARRQSEGVGGTLMEIEIELTLDPENMGEWEVVTP